MILGEVVHKGDDRTSALDESPAKVHIGDVRELVVRDIQQLGQLLTVGSRLVQHDQELTVCQHGTGGVRLEQVIYILCQAGAAGTILPHPLPEGKQEVGAVLMLEQQVG